MLDPETFALEVADALGLHPGPALRDVPYIEEDISPDRLAKLVSPSRWMSLGLLPFPPPLHRLTAALPFEAQVKSVQSSPDGAEVHACFVSKLVCATQVSAGIS